MNFFGDLIGSIHGEAHLLTCGRLISKCTAHIKCSNRTRRECQISIVDGGNSLTIGATFAEVLVFLIDPSRGEACSARGYSRRIAINLCGGDDWKCGCVCVDRMNEAYGGQVFVRISGAHIAIIRSTCSSHALFNSIERILGSGRGINSIPYATTISRVYYGAQIDHSTFIRIARAESGAPRL